MLTVILEDFAATSGILIAISGIIASHITSNPVYDSIASISVGALLVRSSHIYLFPSFHFSFKKGWVAFSLVRMNRDYLVGKAIDKPINKEIQEMIKKRPSVDSLHSIYSRWEGPSIFAFKVDIDFNGSYFSNQLIPYYKNRILEAANDPVKFKKLMECYTEDVTRMMVRSSPSSFFLQLLFYFANRRKKCS